MQDRHRSVGGLLVLTVLGFLLLVPPIVHLFNHDFAVLGVPQIVFYLFGVWLALIVGTWALTRHVPPEPSGGGSEGES